MTGAFLILQQFFFGFLGNSFLEIHTLNTPATISLFVVLFFILVASFYFVRYFWFLKKKNGFFIR